MQGPDPEAYAHYVQNQLSPRSRADYDAFNRIHFERLHSARGVRRKQEVKRAVTPKVGTGGRSGGQERESEGALQGHIHFERLHTARGVRRKQEVQRVVAPKARTAGRRDGQERGWEGA